MLLAGKVCVGFTSRQHPRRVCSGPSRPERIAAIQRQDTVGPGFAPPQILQLRQFLGILLGQVFRFGEVFGEVIELPAVVIKASVGIGER